MRKLLKFPVFTAFEYSYSTRVENNIMHFLTEWEGRTEKYLARGHGVRTSAASLERYDREPNVKPYGLTSLNQYKQFIVPPLLCQILLQRVEKMLVNGR